MKHPIVIDSDGEIRNVNDPVGNVARSFKKSFHQIFNAPLRPDTILMSESDWQDILAWSKEVEDDI
jgi:hypothetical protein